MEENNEITIKTERVCHNVVSRGDIWELYIKKGKEAIIALPFVKASKVLPLEGYSEKELIEWEDKFKGHHIFDVYSRNKDERVILVFEKGYKSI